MIPVAAANLGNRGDAAVMRGLLDYANRVCVIGMQEAGDRHPMLNRFCKDSGWRMYYSAEVEGSASVPILWNPDRVVASQQTVRPATGATDCGSCGAGPDTVKAKVWNKVRFHPRTRDGSFVLINGHLPASLHCKCRKRLGRDMIEELADMFARREGRLRVVATMDGNSSSWMPIWRPLRATGARQWVRFPTLGRRSVDMIWTLGVKQAVPIKPGVKYSDHVWPILQIG